MFSMRRLPGLTFVVVAALGTLGYAQESGFEVLGIGGGGGMDTPAVSPYDPNLMLISCDMGNDFRSTDGGRHWQTIHHRQLNSSIRCRPLFLKERILWVSGPTPKISADKGVTWEPLVKGELPWKGQVIRMAADSADESALLFGTDAGEIWRSADAGKTWKLAHQGKLGSILALGGRLYVAIDARVIVSTDKGETWKDLDVAASAPETKEKGFLSLAGGAADGKTVLYGIAVGAGLFQSLDEGKTWKKVDEARNCDDVMMASNQTKVAYAAEGRYDPKATGVFRTVDGGATWERCFRYAGPNANVEVSWTDTELNWGYYLTPLSLGVSATDPKLAFVTTQGDFFITRDGGQTWKQGVNVALGVKEGDPGPRYQGIGLEVTSAHDYRFDPLVKDRTYITYADIGLARSVDRGKSWISSRKGCPWGNSFYEIIFDPTVPGRIYAATAMRHEIPQWTAIDKNKRNHTGGVCVSEDGGDSWKPLGKGLPELPCTSICIDPKSPRENLTLYTTVFEGGVYKSVDDGKTWANSSTGLGCDGNLHAFKVLVHPKTGDVYCSITAFREPPNKYPVPGGLWKSTDGGKTWTDITKDLKLLWPGNFAFDPQNPDLIYLTAASATGSSQGGLYATRDGGKTWDRMMKDEDFAKTGPPDFVHCFYVNLHPTKPNHIYLGTTTHGLWMSPDGGKTWKRFESLPFKSVANVSFDPQDTEVMYVCTFGNGVLRGHYLPAP